MLVRDAMTRRVTTVTPTTEVTTALRLLYIQHIRHLPVVEDGQLVGIVSDRDLRPAPPAATGSDHLVGGVMTPAVRWVRPDDDLYAAIRDMLAWRISALPVVDHHQLVGILTTTDCLHALLDVAQTQIDAPSS